jgi:glycerol kinase
VPADFIAAVDQGTASSRCLIFDAEGRVVSVGQKEHRQIFPRPGWVEHDAEEIWRNVVAVVGEALLNAQLQAGDLQALGITNQRETTVVWDRVTGRPVHNAINWQDTRTDQLIRELAGDGGQDRFRRRCGLPLATYFSGPKLAWMLDHVEGLRTHAEAGEVLFGTIDSWLIWKLTGEHVTDVTNASRTMLMDLGTLEWDSVLLDAFGVPEAMLPEIRSSSEIYGEAGMFGGVPVASALGDQSAALFGQTCYERGDAKCTYGTGSFLLMNTGTEPAWSNNGLLTTVGYKIGAQATTYALEGSIAVTGALVQWLRDNLELIGSAPEIETLARTVDDNGGCYFVPAFSGLFAPHWRSDARGVIAGLTSYITKGHLARAVLEATAFQTREVVEAMNGDATIALAALRVDGGMTANNLLMQFLADMLDVPVVRPIVAETPSLGAAYAAGLAVGFWPDTDSLRTHWHRAAEWLPQMDPAKREKSYRKWKMTVARTHDWVTDDDWAERAACARSAGRSGLDQPVRVEDELLGHARVEVLVAVRRLVERDDGRVDGLGDVGAVVQDHLHQPAVVAHHGALAGREGVRLRPAEADADRQRALLGRVVDRARVAGHVQPGDAELAGRAGDVHDRVQHGRGRLVVGVGAVPARLEPDGIDGRVDLRLAEDLLDLVPGVALGDVDRFAAEALGLREALGNEVAHEHDGRAQQQRRIGRGEPDRPSAGDVYRRPRPHARGVGAVEARREDVREHGEVEDLLHRPVLVRELQEVPVGVWDQHVLGLAADPSAHVDVPVGRARSIGIDVLADARVALLAIAAAPAGDVEGH